jgi:hypothetical protein
MKRATPKLIYFELHVDDQTFIVHGVVPAKGAEDALNKVKDLNGKHYHLQVKGYLGSASKTNMIRWLKAGIPSDAVVRKLSPLQASYKNAVCPDCGDPIRKFYKEGSACRTCGHVFWIMTPVSKGQ